MSQVDNVSSVSSVGDVTVMTGVRHGTGRGRKADPRAEPCKPSSAPPNLAPKAASIRRKDNGSRRRRDKRQELLLHLPAPNGLLRAHAPSATDGMAPGCASAHPKRPCLRKVPTTSTNVGAKLSSAPKQSLTRRPSANFARRASSRRRRRRLSLRRVRLSTAPCPPAPSFHSSILEMRETANGFALICLVIP